ncbi:hypothetical protein MRX96_023663 [Rhipicephalus microplus]
MAKPTAKPTPSALTERPSPPEPCTTTDCRSLADYLRRQVDANRDPCVDFYEYACGNYRGGSVLLEMGERVVAAVNSLLLSVYVPDRSQTAVQKAVGMFRACLAAPEDNRRVEMRALKDFMVTLDMDLLAEESSDPNPGRDIVRLSLEYGLHAFVEFRLALAESDEVWFTERAFLKASVKASYYRALIAHYSGRASSGRVKALVSQLSALEDEDEFERIIDKYSLGRYTSDDGVYVDPDARALLKLLVTQGREAELHRLVSWSIVRQLAGFGRSSETFGVLSGNAVWYKCLTKVSQVMEAPLMGVHLLKAVPEDYLAEVDRIYSRLKTSYERQLRSSSWLDVLSLKFALDKLHVMRLANGIPARLAKRARDGRALRRIPRVAEWRLLLAHLAQRGTHCESPSGDQ